MFDISYGWYFICNVTMTSNLRFHDFLPTFLWTQYKMLISAKRPVYFQILSCYFIDIRLKLHCVKFALNWKNIKKQERGIPMSISPKLFNLKKASLCRVKFPNSLKCLNEADQVEWINNNYHIFENVFIKYFFHLRFFSRYRFKCSIFDQFVCSM